MNESVVLPELSLVIPTYDSAEWLPSTLESVKKALGQVAMTVEVVVIDDGSTDNTQEVVSQIAATFPVEMRLIAQENQGVFLARRRGAHEARSSRLLFLDSRVLIDQRALTHLERELTSGPSVNATRIGHVSTDDSVPLVGRFWEVPTHVFWGSYLRQPTLTELTESNFDSIPKGTGFLLVSKELFLEACNEIGTEVGRFVSDDTKLLRYLVTREVMFLDPGFHATYRPRTSAKKFLAHGFLRGTLFVDSYYGTSPARNIVLWGIALSAPLLVAAIIWATLVHSWFVPIALLSIFILLVVALLLIAKINNAPRRALVSFGLYILPFAGVFWAGIVRGLRVRFRGNV
ncbi:MAG: glycosyltransferase family 2 protein [Aeromicrobium sp.]|nr:MAG: glycosyltransferase family 2 protein [Aeromicrobium sp.]